MNSRALLQKSIRLAVESVGSELPLLPSTECKSVAISAKRRCAGADTNIATDTRSTIKKASMSRKFMVVRFVCVVGLVLSFDCDVSQKIGKERGKQLIELKID